ncbi:105R [Invertebrate iridescent virus 6]|uniref:105R n=1 Tax=Invertebrate iridescent virus 6 TaxID=176652 RepID=Q91G16_IIV6|nr:105R [Invertebrate iridescent virus 6]AAK82016.1 105R [Invertebrate iridescent virus 6]
MWHFLFIDDKKLIIKNINQNNFRYMILTSPWGSSSRSPWGSASWRTTSWRSPRTTSRRSSLRRSPTFRRRRTSFR